MKKIFLALPLLLILACKNDVKQDASAQGTASDSLPATVQHVHDTMPAATTTDTSRIKDMANLPAGEAKIYKEIMALHDKSMEDISEVMKLQKQIEPAYKKVKFAQQPDTKLNDQLRDAMSGLKKAEDVMWRWMHEFEMAKDTVRANQMNAFLTLELMKIKQIDNVIKEGIRTGQSAVTTNPALFK